MAFIKDAETKVYKDKILKNNTDKTASKKESVRYTIDDLVSDTDGPEEGVDAGEEDVSH